MIFMKEKIKKKLTYLNNTYVFLLVNRLLIYNLMIHLFFGFYLAIAPIIEKIDC